MAVKVSITHPQSSREHDDIEETSEFIDSISIGDGYDTAEGRRWGDGDGDGDGGEDGEEGGQDTLNIADTMRRQ